MMRKAGLKRADDGRGIDFMADVIFMGTPDFAAGIFQALLDSEYNVKAVFTQPDRPKGRKGLLQAPPVKELAAAHDIPVYQPDRIRRDENVQTIRDYHPDFIVVAAFGQIIPASILEVPSYCCLNVHASLLPRWRGAAPVQWSIMEGDTVSGVTIMKMAEGLDTGDCIEQSEVSISDDETGGTLTEKLMRSGEDLIIRTMREIEDGTAVYTPQPEKSPTPYAKMLSRQTGIIDWKRSAQEIERQIRALDPWPAAHTCLNGRMLKLWKAEKAGIQAGEADAEPGTILKAVTDGITVRTGDGDLRILELQPEGKKRMAAGAFLRGNHVEEGTILG